MPTRSHKASAHSARWHFVIQSFCFWARWPYYCCMLSRPFSDASIVASQRNKGHVASFPFSNVLVCLILEIHNHFTALFHMEPISGGACKFFFEDQPPDAYEFQFYKVVQFLFFFLPDCLIHLFSLLTMPHLSLEHSLDWCKSPSLISRQGRIRMPKPHDYTAHLPLVLPSCSVPFLFLFCTL